VPGRALPNPSDNSAAFGVVLPTVPPTRGSLDMQLQRCSHNRPFNVDARKQPPDSALDPNQSSGHWLPQSGGTERPLRRPG
jgi:hypothetical protein